MKKLTKNDLGEVDALSLLSQSEGWKYLQKYINERKEMVEDTMFRPDTDLSAIKFSGYDMLRFQRNIWVYISELPKNVIDVIKEENDNIPNYDPYESQKE